MALNLKKCSTIYLILFVFLLDSVCFAKVQESYSRAEKYYPDLITKSNPVNKSDGKVDFLFKAKSGHLELTLYIYDEISNLVYTTSDDFDISDSLSYQELCTWDFVNTQSRIVSSRTYLAVLKIKNLDNGEVQHVKKLIGIKKD